MSSSPRFKRAVSEVAAVAVVYFAVSRLAQWMAIPPVVVLTSSREEQDIVETYKLGVNSYIVKSVGFEKFVESVKKIGLYWLLPNAIPK